MNTKNTAVADGKIGEEEYKVGEKLSYMRDKRNSGRRCKIWKVEGRKWKIQTHGGIRKLRTSSQEEEYFGDPYILI
jgi:hypothetical protein